MKYQFYKIQGSQDFCLLHLGVAPDQSATSTNLGSPTGINRINWIRHSSSSSHKRELASYNHSTASKQIICACFSFVIVGGGGGGASKEGWERY